LRGHLQGSSLNNKEDEENVALTTKGKMMSKKGPKARAKQQGDHKKDM